MCDLSIRSAWTWADLVSPGLACVSGGTNPITEVQLSAQGQIGIGGRPMLDALAVGPVLFFCCCCGCFWYQACMGLLQLLINSLFFLWRRQATGVDR